MEKEKGGKKSTGDRFKDLAFQVAGSLITGNFGGGLANGGMVAPNTPYLVGERGAELFVPSSSGQVVPNGGFGGVTVNQSINVSTGISQTVRAEIMNMLPLIKGETINAVAETRRRGGSFARTFGA
jgi:phage-related minor tail protein